MSLHPDPLPALYVPGLHQQRGERERERGNAIFNEFCAVTEIVTLAWIDNASVQFPLNIYATKGLIPATAGSFPRVRQFPSRWRPAVFAVSNSTPASPGTNPKPATARQKAVSFFPRPLAALRIAARTRRSIAGATRSAPSPR